jgi:hypothetical protein
VSTTLLNKADSANDFAVALSQPVAIPNIVEPAAIVEPVIPFFGAPIVEPPVPVVGPIVPYIGNPRIDPLIPYDPRVISPLGPVVEPVLPYLGSPYGPVFEPLTAYNFPGYYGLGTAF